jgi:hypothetical protein
MQMESHRRYRTFLIVLVYLIVAIYGVGLSSSFEVNQRDYLYSIIIAFVLTQICIVDGKIAGKPLLPNTYWLVLIFFPVAVPVLIIRAHGIKGAGVFIIHLLGLIFVLVVTLLITNYFLYGTFFPSGL